MEVTIGKEGLTKTWQDDFSETTECCRCGGESRIGFVAHEGLDRRYGDESSEDWKNAVCRLHNNEGKGGYWLHDYCSVAVYFCRGCLEPTALYNQG